MSYFMIDDTRLIRTQVDDQLQQNWMLSGLVEVLCRRNRHGKQFNVDQKLFSLTFHPTEKSSVILVHTRDLICKIVNTPSDYSES